MKTKRIFLVSCLFASYFLASCAAINTPSGQPGRKATPMEQVMVWNAGIADSNLAIAKGVIAASEANQVDVPTANAILTEQSRIADADRQLTPVLAKACTLPSSGQAGTAPTTSCNPALLSGDSAAIKGFLDQIAASGKNLAAVGVAGVKNPQSAQAIQKAIGDISLLTGEMVTALQQLGVLR